jgi:hypothetical protein
MMNDFQNRRRVTAAGLCRAPGGHPYRWDGSRDGADTLGDQPNDVEMFKRSGLSIAMGNASVEVKRQATCVTTSFAGEGFANAAERFILPRVGPARGAALKATEILLRLRRCQIPPGWA